MSDKSLFMAHEVWKGGHYELFIRPSADSPEGVCSTLRALWSFPSLDGCYLRRDCEPSFQARVKPCENGVKGHLYGLAKVRGGVVVCGSYAIDDSGEEGSNAGYWITFYLPPGAISEKFPVGAYPFAPMDDVSEWKAQVDSFLVKIANWVHRRSPIRLGLVGFEVNMEVSAETIRADGIPKERSDGILWDDATETRAVAPQHLRAGRTSFSDLQNV